MKKFIALIFLLFALAGWGCNGGNSWSPPSRSLAGSWEAVLPDGDFDGKTDETPFYYAYLDISSHVNGLVSGTFTRQWGTNHSNAPLTGYTDGDVFHLSTNLDGERIDLSGNLASASGDLGRDCIIADWTSSAGQSGVFVFTAVGLRLMNPASKVGAQIHPSVPGELASLKKDGGSGRLLIFVHGLLSHPSAWDPIVNRMKSEGYFEHYEIWRFGYDTRQPFEVIGQEFYDLMKENGLLERIPVIVAHSMGGLVSRSYIALGGSFSRLVTLGTPHCGTPTGAGGIFTGPGTVEMTTCSPSIVALFAKEKQGNFPKYAVVSGEITGSWHQITVHKCLPHCPPVGPCCFDTHVPVWEFDRDYSPVLKAGWVYIKAAGFGDDNDGAVPTPSENFCATWRDKFPCNICPPIDYGRDKHLTNYDHFMLIDPNVAPDVYQFIIDHL